MEWLSHPIVQGTVTGLLSAAAVDFAAFKSWKNVQEALTYNWTVAVWRWFQGAAVGAISAAGLQGLMA